MGAKKYDVFLSHSKRDGAAVEQLALRLREAGLQPFFDELDLVPGERSIPDLRNALDQSRTCAIFFGPRGRGQKRLGPWQDQEIQQALIRRNRDEGFRIIPVLLPGSVRPAEEPLPSFVELYTWVDFSTSLDDADALHRLCCGIRGLEPGPRAAEGGEAAVAAPRPRNMATPLEGFIPRHQYGDILAHLTASPDGLTAIAPTSALQGAGGFGKTAMAQALCHDEAISRAFPDGILWAQMRDEMNEGDRILQVREVLRFFLETAEPPLFETLTATGARLREELAGRRVLLVVDDVWSAADLQPFRGLGSGCAVLVTTRNRSTLPASARRFEVDAMASAEAIGLLTRGLPPLGGDVGALVTRLGEWPLLLKLVNGVLAELIADGMDADQALAEVAADLEAEGLTVFDHEDEEARELAVRHTMKPSLARLTTQERWRYEQLAIFPEDVDVPLALLGRLWNTRRGETRRLCKRLRSLSLLLRYDGTSVRLHDVVRNYLIHHGAKDLPALQKQFLDACKPTSGRWSDLDGEEVYLWRHLAHHLHQANPDALRELLWDFSYLQRKLEVTRDINALLADYEPLRYERDLNLVQRALRLSAHTLIKDRGQLANQLLGRLLGAEAPAIQRLLVDARDASLGRARIEPLHPSLAAPGHQLRILEGHHGSVNALAVLGDGRVVSGSEDGTLRIWDVESGELLRTLEVHKSMIGDVAVLDDRRVISIDYRGVLCVWDVESGEKLSSIEMSRFESSCMAVLQDGRVISGSSIGGLHIWDVDCKEELRRLDVHKSEIRSIAVLRDGRVVSGSEDCTLQVCDVNRGELLCTLKGKSRVCSVAALDDTRVVSGSEDGTLRVWDVESGESLRTLEGHTSGVQDVVVLDDGRVISASSDATLRVWDADTGKALCALKGHETEVNCVAVLDDGRVISGSHDFTVRVWDIMGGSESSVTLEGHASTVGGVAALKNGRAVSGSFDGTLRVWDVDSGETLRTLPAHAEVGSVLALDSGLVVSGFEDGSLRVWDVDRGKSLRTLEGHTSKVRSVAELSNGRVVSGSFDGTLRVWDVKSTKALHTLKAGKTWTLVVAVLNESRIVSTFGDRVLRVWDIEHDQVLQTLEGHTDLVGSVVVLGDGRVVSGSVDGTLRVWDVKGGKLLRTLECQTSRIRSVAVLRDELVVSGSDDGILRAWDVERGEELARFYADAGIWCLSGSPDGKTIIAGDRCGKVHFLRFEAPHLSSSQPQRQGSST